MCACFTCSQCKETLPGVSFVLGKCFDCVGYSPEEYNAIRELVFDRTTTTDSREIDRMIYDVYRIKLIFKKDLTKK